MKLKDNLLTLSLAILSLAAGAFLPYFPHVPANLATTLVGFLGSVGMLIKTYQQPPATLKEAPPTDEPKP